MLELPGNMYDDISDIYYLSGGPRVIPSYKNPASQRNHDPKLIPQIIHQTYKSSQVPNSVRPMMQSWRQANSNWEIRFYDDEACLEFVQHEFPEYLDAYRYVFAPHTSCTLLLGRCYLAAEPVYTTSFSVVIQSEHLI